MTVAAVAGGTVVTPDGSRRADVLVSGEKIAAIGRADPGPAQHVIDAAGCYVLPGGVDPHAHLLANIPHATAAAARGGTTTALSFTNPEAGDNDVSCLLRRRAEAAGGTSAVDLGLHAMLGDPEHVTADDLAAIRQAGAGAIKVFLAYPGLGIMCSPARLFELMTQARRLGLLVQVHCENGPLIEALQAEGLAAGRRGATLFAGTRPPEVEAESVASAMATAAISHSPCYLVHLSSADAIDEIRLARTRQRPPVFAEVCLHHLLLDDRRVTGADAGRFLVCPPLRPAEHVEALWQAIADGTIDAVGSDHCQDRSPVSDEIPADAGGTGGLAYGLAGIGARLPLLLSEGLARGVPIGRLAQLACENPARIFGHYPRKGVLAPGSDADIVVYDPAGERVLGDTAFGDGTSPSPYEGCRQRGSIRAVVRRGHLIAADDALTGQGGGGRYLPAGHAAGLREDVVASG